MNERDQESDQALIDAARAGAEAAFEALYYRYRDWVVRLAYRITGQEADALDVLQETFAYLLKKLPRLTLTARMTTFLYPAVKHLSVRLARKRRRHAPGDEGLTEAQAPPAKQSSRAELATALGALPEAQREVVLMRFVDDMSLSEIAEALKVPIGTVKSRLHNALRTLREDEGMQRRFFE